MVTSLTELDVEPEAVAEVEAGTLLLNRMGGEHVPMAT